MTQQFFPCSCKKKSVALEYKFHKTISSHVHVRAYWLPEVMCHSCESGNPENDAVAPETKLSGIHNKTQLGPHFHGDDSCLSTSEQNTISQIKSPTFYHQKAWSFLMTRLVLGEVLGCAPAGLEIDRTSKPHIIGRYKAPVFFNISHSDRLWAIAWSFETDVGIDVQKIDPTINYQAIMRQFFTEHERSNIHTYLDFFRLWTQKEALLKLHGRSFAHIRNIHDDKATIKPLHIQKEFMAHVAMI